MIRQATFEDVTRCADLAESFFHARNERGEFDKKAFVDFWRSAFDSCMGRILLRESDGHLFEAVGYIKHVGMNGKMCVSTMFWYVSDANQGLAAGTLLAAFADEVAAVSETRIALLIDDRLKDISTVLGKYGFKSNEIVYLKEEKCLG